MKTIAISGVIGADVLAASIRAQLDEARGQSVRVEINSPGGLVSEGLELFNLINNYSGDITTHVMGEAASMASYVALAGRRVTGEANMVFMLHEVRGGSIGTADDLKKTAEIFEGLNALLAQAYAKKSGKSVDEIRAAMKTETWLFGAEAKEAGFVDEIIGEATETRAQAFARAQARAAASARAEAASDPYRVAALLGTMPAARAIPSRYERLLAEGIDSAQTEALEDLRAADIKTIGRFIATGQDAAATEAAGVRVKLIDELLARAPRIRSVREEMLAAAKSSNAEAEAAEIKALAAGIAAAWKR